MWSYSSFSNCFTLPEHASSLAAVQDKSNARKKTGLPESCLQNTIETVSAGEENACDENESV